MSPQAVTDSEQVITAPVLVLVGPTAIGKTELSLAMAHRFGCEIISVDSMQVYRHMDIGTAKPSLEERGGVPHHLIDIVDPREQYDAARFVEDALRAIGGIVSRGNIPLLTGGTGLYLKALTEGLFAAAFSDEAIRSRLNRRLRQEGGESLYRELQAVDPETAARLHVNDGQRLTRALEIFYGTGIPWSVHLRRQPDRRAKFSRLLLLGLSCERDSLYERIEQRTGQMMAQGFVREVEKLLDMGYSPDLKAMQAIGYRHVNNYLAGKWGRAETIRLLVRDTRRYAKRQLTWFRANPAMNWYDREDVGKVMDHAARFLESAQK